MLNVALGVSQREGVQPADIFCPLLIINTGLSLSGVCGCGIRQYGEESSNGSDFVHPNFLNHGDGCILPHKCKHQGG